MCSNWSIPFSYENSCRKKDNWIELKSLHSFSLMCIVCFEFRSLDVVAGTDEFSGFSLFVGLNCSDLSFVYQHSGPVIPSSRVSLTFQANAPKVARCIGYRNNRTINSVPPGYSTDAKADICNLEVLGEACTRIIRGSVNHILCWDNFFKKSNDIFVNFSLVNQTFLRILYVIEFKIVYFVTHVYFIILIKSFIT